MRREQVLNRLAAKLDGRRERPHRARRGGGEPPLRVRRDRPERAPRARLLLAQRERQFPGSGCATATCARTRRAGWRARARGQGKITPRIDDFRSRGYEGNETVGKGGVEQQYESFLRGTPGSYTREVDSGASRPAARSSRRASARPGRDVQLTIDATAQAALQQALAEQVSLNGLSTGAAGVALDPDTGEVLALASYPDFDPSLFVNGSQERIEAVIADPDKVLLNRAIGGNYPAGSTFKAVSAAEPRGRLHHGRRGGRVAAADRAVQDGLLELRGRSTATWTCRLRSRSRRHLLLPAGRRVLPGPGIAAAGGGAQVRARRAHRPRPARRGRARSRTRPGSGRTSRARRSPTSTAAGSPGTRSTCRSGRAT